MVFTDGFCEKGKRSQKLSLGPEWLSKWATEKRTCQAGEDRSGVDLALVREVCGSPREQQAGNEAWGDGVMISFTGLKDQGILHLFRGFQASQPSRPHVQVTLAARGRPSEGSPPQQPRKLFVHFFLPKWGRWSGQTPLKAKVPWRLRSVQRPHFWLCWESEHPA
jgi:hypothetical protein